MLQSIWDDVKREFSVGNAVTRLIIINVVVFVAINLLWVVLRISNEWQDPASFHAIKNFFLISSDWVHNLTHPWVIITHAFVHHDFWHILWNMLFMYWFGRIVGDFIGNQRILPIYLLGAIAGGLTYILTINFLSYGGEGVHYAEGASGAVMAIVVAAGTISPDYIMRLLFLGDVKLKYIVAVLVFLDLIGIANDINTGGHFAHLGGALFGFIFVKQLRDGNDWSVPVNSLLDTVSNFFKNFTRTAQKPKKGPRMVYKNPVKTKKTHSGSKKGNAVSDQEDLSHQEQLDAILDKISQFGYESLSEEEKEFLFNASKK